MTCDRGLEKGNKYQLSIAFFLKHKPSSCLYKTWRWEMQMWEVTFLILLVCKLWNFLPFLTSVCRHSKVNWNFSFRNSALSNFLKRNYISLQHCKRGWDYSWSSILMFSEACKTYKHAEKHERGHKVLFWLVPVLWHISRLWFSDIIDEWRFGWLWGVLHIFFLNKNYVPDCIMIYWGWNSVRGLYCIFFSCC